MGLNREGDVICQMKAYNSIPGIDNMYKTLNDNLDEDLLVGITATLPVELIFASGLRPIDLNNLFITSENPEKLVIKAEAEGFPYNICAWIKGIYSSVMHYNIRNVVAVTGGDCSNTFALAELLARKGIRVLTFDYPLDRNKEALKTQMEKLSVELNVKEKDIETVRLLLNSIRKKLTRLDRMTWQDNVISGFENHLYLVSSSDFYGDPRKFENSLDTFLDKAERRQPMSEKVRIGYLGVPPIFSDIYEVIESRGGRVVFNEVQRQFSMPFYNNGMTNQYLEYTYPYGINHRLKDIAHAIKERRLDGLIHYSQTFCYRQLYDISLRESLSIPILTLEGDRPGVMDSRTILRIETFLEMLTDKVGFSSRS